MQWVCKLTCVTCKPAHIFFQLFIATRANSLQASFNIFLKNWPYEYYELGAPIKEQMYVYFNRKSVACM